MSQAYDCHACQEYNELSRRQFLGASGGALLLAAGAPAWLPRVAYAGDACTDRDVIISIFLRGAHDGLTMCAPYADADYYVHRPNLNVPPPDSGSQNRATDLDGFFGLPPAMTPILPAYQAGHLAIVHACGSHDPSRSHFDAQRFMEVGTPNDPFLATGWLGRHLAVTSPMLPGSALRAVGIGYGLQRTLIGGPQTLPIPDLDNFGLAGAAGTMAARRATIEQMYQTAEASLSAAAQNTTYTIDLLNQINFAGYVPGGGAVYPVSSYGTALKSSAALIKAEVGVEAIAIDVGGWDTHNAQGIFQGGTMYNLMSSLSAGLAAFHADMMSTTNNWTLLVMSEFGRRVRENGSNGTDHGHGNCMIVMGGYIQGGQVMRIWPGLAPGQLYQNLDLQVTIDYRDIVAEVLQRRCGNTNLGAVFPNFTPTFRNIVRSC